MRGGRRQTRSRNGPVGGAWKSAPVRPGHLSHHPGGDSTQFGTERPWRSREVRTILPVHTGGVDHAEAVDVLRLRSRGVGDVPRDLSLRDRLRRRLRRADTPRWRGPAAPGARARGGCGAADHLCRPAQRHGAALVQGVVDADRAVDDRALDLRPLRQPRADPALLAVAADWHRGLDGRQSVHPRGALGTVRGGVGHGPRGDVPDQPLRPVRPSPGMAAADWEAVHAHRVPDADALPLRPPPAVLRIPAGVLDDADHDARASRLRDHDDGVHRPRDSVRGARPYFGIWPGVSGVPDARADAAARDRRYAVASTAIRAISHRIAVAVSAAVTVGHGNWRSTPYRSTIHCQAVCATSAERTIVPILSATTKRKSTSSAGTISTSTSSWPSSTPTLKESSDVSRYEPANCTVCCRPNEKPKPCTRPNRNVMSHRRRGVTTTMFSSAM